MYPRISVPQTVRKVCSGKTHSVPFCVAAEGGDCCQPPGVRARHPPGRHLPGRVQCLSGITHLDYRKRSGKNSTTVCFQTLFNNIIIWENQITDLSVELTLCACEVF